MLRLWSLSWQIILANPSWHNLIIRLLKANDLSWPLSEQDVTRKKDEMMYKRTAVVGFDMEGEGLSANCTEGSGSWEQPSIYSQQENRNLGPIISRNCILPMTRD